jgi:hypothetical protein
VVQLSDILINFSTYMTTAATSCILCAVMRDCLPRTSGLVTHCGRPRATRVRHGLPHTRSINSSHSHSPFFVITDKLDVLGFRPNPWLWSRALLGPGLEYPFCVLSVPPSRYNACPLRQHPSLTTDYRTNFKLPNCGWPNRSNAVLLCCVSEV